MKPKLLVANWKMNPLKLKDAQKLAALLNKVRTKNKVVLCPPVIYLPVLKTKFDLGVQNIFWLETGPDTGEISPLMAKQFKAKYALIGHSERRTMGETDGQVHDKLHAALRDKLVPILCVGFGLTSAESEEDVLMHLQDQLQQDLDGVDPKKVIVAYEPVWAIGSGKPATPEHAERVAMFIRIKFKIKKVLYGGSTNAENAEQFLRKEIDGLLVGGASIQPAEFARMIAKNY